MSIDLGDSQSECVTFDNTHNLDFPTIAGNDGGTGICNAYNIGAYPTYILIAPDHSIVEQDMWPISSASDFDGFIQPHGLTHQSCSTTGSDTYELNTEINLFPNPTSNNVNIQFNYSGDFTLIISNILGEVVYEQNKSSNGQFFTNIDLQDIKKGVYLVSVKTNENIFTKKLTIK